LTFWDADTPRSWEVQIHARAKLDKHQPEDVPVISLLVNGAAIGQATVSSIDWETYRFSLVTAERTPQITIIHQDGTDSQRAVIIDKVRID
jgi:hypothetical protein